MSLSSVSIPKSYKNAILVPAWKQAMNEEMDALVSRETWDLISLPKEQWLFVALDLYLEVSPG